MKPAGKAPPNLRPTNGCHNCKHSSESGWHSIYCDKYPKACGIDEVDTCDDWEESDETLATARDGH